MGEINLDNRNKTSSRLAGLAALGSVVSGILALFGALFPFFNGDYAAAGFMLIAAALAFGMLANAVFRA